METLKNFFTGLLVIIMSLVIFVVIVFTWPILLGISSIILALLSAVLFVVLIFYIVVLVGHATRYLIKK